MILDTVRLHSIPGIKRKVITTNLDDYTGDAASSPVRMPDPTVIMTFRGDTVLLYYREPMCPRCLSRNTSKNGTYMREVSGQSIMVQRYICRDCSYSFETRPPGYGYGKHISDEVRKKSVRARLQSPLRKGTFRQLDPTRNLYSDHQVIRGFLRFLKKNHSLVFRYLDDPMINRINNVDEHHFYVRSELLKNRFKTDRGILKTPYWYHRQSTEN